MRRVWWLVLALAVGCSDSTAPEPPPIEVSILAPGVADQLFELDTLLLLGEASASDLGLLPDDSLWWTRDDEVLGRGRRVVTRAIAGGQTIWLHAQYGARTERAVLHLDVRSGGLGRLLWTVPLDTNPSDGLAMEHSGRTLYASDRRGGVAVAIGLDGSVGWRTDLGSVARWSPPAVSPTGMLYYGAYVQGLRGAVLALDGDGQRRWTFVLAEYAEPNSGVLLVAGGPALDAAGNVYVAPEEAAAPLYSIRPDGSLRWRTATAPGTSDRFRSHTTVIGDSLVVSLRQAAGVPFVGTDDGVVHWEAPGKNSNCKLAPAIGPDGTIYLPNYSPSRISAYGAGGELRWTRALPVAAFSGSPIVGHDRIYFAGRNGAVLVLSIEGDSVAVWGPPLAGPLHDGISLGANGVVYVAAADTLVSYDAAGARRFAVPIPHTIGQCYEVKGGPVIGADGTVYVRASHAGVMAFRDTVGPASDAAWPTLQGGFTRQGRRATDR